MLVGFVYTRSWKMVAIHYQYILRFLPCKRYNNVVTWLAGTPLFFLLLRTYLSRRKGVIYT